MFPTETVYGVGAAARDAAAVERVFVAKQRPPDRAVTVHVAADWPLDAWATAVPDGAHDLVAAFWPGPLTLVLPARDDVPEVVRGGGATVGLRAPDHPTAIELLAAFGDAVVGSSANRHGGAPATTVEEARAALGSTVDAYLDGGPCRLGVGSTVIDLSGGRPLARRVGAVSLDDVARVLGEPVAPA